MKLPMVWEPKEYIYSEHPNQNVLGGFLLNDVEYTEEIFKDKKGYGKKTTFKDNNLIVSLINGLSKTPYKTNTDTLEYIYKYGVEKGIVTDDSEINIKTYKKDPYSGFNKRDSKKYRSIYSKILLERNILSIADVYSKVSKIYFPLRLDNRTRVYCETDYFHYQSSDLAKGLISFAVPGLLTKNNTEEINYFKAFGANMFGDKLDKKSLNHRVRWVDINSEYILNFENNDIVNKAENKACFVSFCFEYRRFKEFMNNIEETAFHTYLPIQLDATCNGYQHLVLLTKESKLFEKLNLSESSHDDAPDDFYTYIEDKSGEYMNSQIINMSKANGNDRTMAQNSLLASLIKLVKIKFDRSIVKKVLMTNSYNAGIPKQVDHIISNLTEQFVGNQKYYTYKNSDIKLSRSDILTYVMTLKGYRLWITKNKRISKIS